MASNMAVAAAIFFFFSFLAGSSNADSWNKMGINYGQLGNNLPSPFESIQILQSLKAGSVKLYDANPEILKLLAGTNMHVSIMVQNHEINRIASDQVAANNWVQDNVLQHYPDTMIRFILVGNEVLSYSSDQDKIIWSNLVPAMRKIKNSLKSHNIQNIKIGTPLAMDVLQITSPPSNGTFRSDISTVMLPLLKFLNGTKSYFFIDAYPFFPYSNNTANVSLNYALFESSQNYTDPNTTFIYTNLLDQMLDSIVFAMTKLGFSNIKLAIAETGWPNAGDLDQPGANIYNAATYNRNLVNKMTTRPALGTPARPGVIIPTFIFSLYNENQKPGPGTERNWGMLRPDGSPIYEIDLSGKRAESDFTALPKPTNNKPYNGKLWCVAANGVNATLLEGAITNACNLGNGTCDSLAPGKNCYNPVTVTWHASYAFSSYWAKFRSRGGSCYFNGLAVQTTTNPSHGPCVVPSVSL